MLSVLRPGSSGPLVSSWQTFLRGQGHPCEVSGLFDAQTRGATIDFQRKHQLEADGIVGNQTYGRAGMLGFELTDFAASDVGYPPIPDHLVPVIGNARRQALFGPLKFEAAPKPGNPEAIRITNGWLADATEEVHIPELAGIVGAPASCRLRLHHRAAGPIRAVWRAWGEKGLLQQVLSFDGALVPRFVRGKAAEQILSNHAFGTAFDINAAQNPLGAQPATRSEAGCVYDVVADAHANGLYWGGHFGRRDGMHFELAEPA